jgi:hypothetical protein
MVTMIGYGPEADFSDNPKAPKWVAKVRYKTTASLIRGMGEMEAGDSGRMRAAEPQEPAKKKKKRFGLGDLLGGAIPH